MQIEKNVYLFVRSFVRAIFFYADSILDKNSNWVSIKRKPQDKFAGGKTSHETDTRTENKRSLFDAQDFLFSHETIDVSRFVVVLRKLDISSVNSIRKHFLF